MRRTGDTFITVTVAAFIVLACLLFLAIVSSSPDKAEWQLQVAGSVDYLSVGGENALYVFSGDNVTSINPDGHVRWAVNVPDCLDLPASNVSILPFYAVDQGNTYIYIANTTPLDQETTESDAGVVRREVLAISPSGRLSWVHRMVDWPSALDFNPSISAAGGRVYIYHANNETVLDDRGNVLFNIGNVFGPAAIDEAGSLYVVPMGNNTANYWPFDNYPGSTFDLWPSRTIAAYDADGKLAWSKDTGDYIHSSTPRSSLEVYQNVPFYNDGSIYFLAGHRIVVLDRSGREQWSHDFGTADIRLNEYMPSDSAGNLYVDAGSEYNHSFPWTYVVKVDQRTVSPVKIPSSIFSYAYLGRVHLYNNLINGICYQINTTDVVDVQPIAWSQFDLQPGIKDLEDIDAISITATDLTADRQLWNFTIPAGDARTAIVNESNVGLIFMSRALEDLGARRQNLSLIGDRMYVDHNSTPIDSWSSVQVLPGNKVTYVAVYDVNFEPIVFNQSRCYYINGLYALNETGQLLWFRPADARIEQAVAGNGTIYYSTGGGKIFSGSTGVVSGVAVLAMAYVFLRFLFIGAVSRARSRLDRNENRNNVYSYVADNPGLTLYDISRDLKMNVGTARYHLMILGLNHRIVTRKAFGKYARYFKNSGTYSLENQLVYSALRRPGIKNILGLLVDRPGLSNREIAGELHMRESAASRYMKELTAIGLVERRNQAEGRHEYYINDQYEETLASTMKSNSEKMF